MDVSPESAGREGTLAAAWRRISPVLAQAGGLRESLERERARWFVWTPVALGTGIAIYFARAHEPSLWIALALPMMALGLASASRRAGLLSILALGVLTASLGFTLAKLRTEWTRAPVLGHEIRRAEVKGIVELIEPRPARGERITLRVTDIKGLAPGDRPERVRIRVMIEREGLKPGDLVRLRATLRPPSVPALPGGYDFARTAWFQRLGATGYAIAPAEIIAQAEARDQSLVQNARDALERLRQGIGERIRAAVPGETGAIAVSLITGERGAITEATNDAYRDSGLVHILSISGLHMVIMAGAVFASIRILLAAFPAIALRFPTKKWAAAAALAGAASYLLISGQSVATQRAFLMIAIMFAAVMLDRQALAMRNVAIAAFVVLAVMPESLLDAGFQMSFAAVVSLIAAYETARSQSSERELAGWLRPVAFFLGGIVLSTVIASLAVAPIGAYHFHRSQQYALLANLISVPICNLIVMPAALLTLVMMPFGLEALPLAIMAKGIDVMSATAHWVASLPGAVMHIPKISDMSFALMIAGGLWLTLWQTRWRMLGLAAIGAGLVVAGDDPRPDVLAGRGGELVALRSSDGTLAAMGSRSGSFELTRWLEHDGDARAPRDVMRGTAFRCDGVGCIAGVRGLTLAVERHPSAAAEDCKKADIVIGGSERSRGCAHPRLVLDRATLRRDGTHAIYLATAQGSEKPAIEKVETVASRRGERPWTERPLRPRRAPAPDTPPENTMGRSPSSDQPTEEMPLDDERD